MRIFFIYLLRFIQSLVIINLSNEICFWYGPNFNKEAARIKKCHLCLEKFQPIKQFTNWLPNAEVLWLIISISGNNKCAKFPIVVNHQCRGRNSHDGICHLRAVSLLCRRLLSVPPGVNSQARVTIAEGMRICFLYHLYFERWRPDRMLTHCFEYLKLIKLIGMFSSWAVKLYSTSYFGTLEIIYVRRSRENSETNKFKTFLQYTFDSHSYVSLSKIKRNLDTIWSNPSTIWLVSNRGFFYAIKTVRNPKKVVNCLKI